jgi:hypothetical protein
MAEFLSSFLQRHAKYTGLTTHQRALRTYLRRCQRLDWQQIDLQHVCHYLFWDMERGLPWTWLDRLACLGSSNFPDNPHFPFYAGSAQMQRGPFGCDIPRATRHFELALELNKHAAAPLALEWVDRAKRALTMLRDHSTIPFGRPYGGHRDFDLLDEEEQEAESFAAFMCADEDGEFDEPTSRPAPDAAPRHFAGGSPPALHAMMGELLELMARASGIDPDVLFEQMAGDDRSRDDRRGGRGKKKIR